MNEMSPPCRVQRPRVSGGTLIACVTYVRTREMHIWLAQSLEPQHLSDIADLHMYATHFDGSPHRVTRRDSQTTRAIGGETITEVSLDELALPQAVVLSRRSPPLLPVMLRDATQSREPGTAADASLSEWIAARANVA